MTEDIQDKIYDVLHSRARQRFINATESNQRFVHYSTAEAAMKMIAGRSVWMRQAICMNDFMEIEYGFGHLRDAYASPSGLRLKNILDGIAAGFSSQLEGNFNDSLGAIRRGEVYLTCVSEHYAHEDINGRLSMWRAYGGDSGVAVVMNGGVFLRPSDAIGAYTYPVYYDDGAAFRHHFDQIVAAVETNLDFLRAVPSEQLLWHFALLFQMLILTTKHPGFAEEKEWRVIYAPHLFNSSRLSKRIECVAGVPQPIVSIALQDVPEEGFIGAEPNSLIDRVIIGPSKLPVTLREAFVRLLLDAGVQSPDSRVWLSEIPLRK